MEVEPGVFERKLDFPACIGPFTMVPANLAAAFNAFYTQHQFPKPDPASDENSMAGLVPHRAGLGQGDVMFCQLSPLHPITLDDEAKAAANIPRDAAFFAWSYPMVADRENPLPARECAEKAFLDYGGYIYFNATRDAVGTNAINPAPLGTLGLMFGRPQILLGPQADILMRQGRFQEVTLEHLARGGATHFGWIRPSEFAESIACPDGGFAYKFRAGPARYFPVVSKPTYTPELLREELDDCEAWVVVRDLGAPPAVETIAVFSRSKSLLDNLDEVGYVPHSAAGGLQTAVCKDSSAERLTSYEEWARGSSSAGSLEDPFILIIYPSSAFSSGGGGEQDLAFDQEVVPFE